MSKTKQRILDTARTLFNERGEHSVTASDIAVELDMSPGNLYYHYKGKDSIHLALFANMQRELVSILAAPVREPDLMSDGEDQSIVERSWLFLTVVLETMLAYRYLYQNPNDLMHRFPEIDRGFRRLVNLQRAACESISLELLGTGHATAQRVESLTNAMSMTLTFWLSYEQIANPKADDTVLVHRGVLQLLSFCAPYLGNEQSSFYNECEALYANMVTRAEFDA